MRGSRASPTEEPSSLVATLSVSLLGCGERCASLESQCSPTDKFSPVRSPSRDEELGLPPALEDCVRLNWGLEHRMTPCVYISIGLQCASKLSQNKRLILRSVDQIQFRKTSSEIRVEIDPCYDQYPIMAIGLSRTSLLEQVLCKLATYVTDLSEQDTPLRENNTRSTPPKLWQRNAAQVCDELVLSEKPKTLEAIESEFDAAYTKLMHPAGHWRGVDRPRLNEAHEVGVLAWPRGTVCSGCRPQVKTDLRIQTKTQLPASESSTVKFLAVKPSADVGGSAAAKYSAGSISEWSRLAATAAEQIREQACALGLKTFNLRSSQMWKPWGEGEVSDMRAQAALENMFDQGGIVRLDALLQRHRLAPKLTDSLVRQLLRRLKDISDHCCVGSYAQVYVGLQRRDDEQTKLRIVLAPVCLLATSKTSAIQINEQFLRQFRSDAGYYVTQ